MNIFIPLHFQISGTYIRRSIHEHKWRGKKTWTNNAYKEPSCDVNNIENNNEYEVNI